MKFLSLVSSVKEQIQSMFGGYLRFVYEYRVFFIVFLEKFQFIPVVLENSNQCFSTHPKIPGLQDIMYYF